MLLDDLVGSLAAHAALHRSHHDGGSHQEGQIAIQLGAHHGLIHAHLVQHGNERLKQAIGSQEGIRQHTAAHHRAGHVTLIPLVADNAANHSEVALQDSVETVHALAGAGVHLMRHGAGAGLPLGKALGAELVAHHEAPGLAEAARAAGQTHQAGNNLKIQRTGIHLAHIHPLGGNTQVGADAGLELAHGIRVLGKEGKLVELRTHSTLEAAHAVALHHAHPGPGPVHNLLTEHSHALAHGRCLGGHIVRAGGKDHIAPAVGALGHAVEHGHRLIADDVHGAPDLQLLHVFGQVAAGHTLVDMLVAGEVAEFLNAGFHVVTRHAFAGVDALHIHLFLHALVGINRLLRNIQPQVFLGLHHSNPELTLQHNAALGRPDGFHGIGGVTPGQYIRNSAHNCIFSVQVKAGLYQIPPRFSSFISETQKRRRCGVSETLFSLCFQAGTG